MIAFLAGTVALVISLIYYSEVCLFPSERDFDVWRFVAMWLRELLILGFAGAVLIACVVVSIISGVRRLRKTDPDLKGAQEASPAAQSASPPNG